MDTSQIIEKNSKEELEELAAQIEAILFAFGEAVAKEKLAEILNVNQTEIEQALQWLESKYNLNPGSGLMLVKHQESLMLGTKPQYQPFIEKLITKDLKEELTSAAIETLAIIAYFGPISRAEIDYLRGVNSSFILRSLLIRGLIDRSLKKNTYTYEISFQFLKYLGIDHVSKMPHYLEYQKIKEKLFSQHSETEPNQAFFESSISSDI